ncbi:hypothetical protein HBB16_06335 [Pseudonocardia sp. MCCB 268]|nr:hypothetical protein [Pseudonocardia cytotoxica]
MLISLAPGHPLLGHRPDHTERTRRGAVERGQYHDRLDPDEDPRLLSPCGRSSPTAPGRNRVDHFRVR